MSSFCSVFYKDHGTWVVLMDNVTINNNYGYENYEYLEEVILKTLEQERAQNAIVSIIFVDEKEIKEINRIYRGKDTVTDVISFALEDNGISAPEEIRVLGDIYICIPRMKEQAKEYGHSEKRELSFLTVHGLLHLLGYDHMETEEEKIMFDLQDKILESLGITR